MTTDEEFEKWFHDNKEKFYPWDKTPSFARGLFDSARKPLEEELDGIKGSYLRSQSEVFALKEEISYFRQRFD